MSGNRVIHGQLVLPKSELPSEAASVLVQIEDVSRADAPSGVVAEQRLPGVRLQPGGVIGFSIEVPNDRINPRSRYSVRAHVDVSGSGEVERGDLVSTQSHPVLSPGTTDDVAIPVRKV